MPRPKEPLIKPAEAVAVALAVIDRDGLDGFNIRKLANEVGVNPSSLYHHFRDKNDILSQVCRLVLDEARVVAPLRVQASWQEYVKKSVARYRRALMDHPNVAPLMTPTAPLGQFGKSLGHRGIAVLLEQGVPTKFVYAIVDSINSLAYGSAMLNPQAADEGQSAASQGDPPEIEDAIKMAQRSPDRLFEMQIDALLLGWTTTLEKESKRNRTAPGRRTKR
jgi:TetR/AcrR family tetracycline transcriptional repressor